MKGFKARDSKKGAIQANGWLRFHHDDKFPYRLELYLRNYSIERIDQFSLTTDANLTLSGSMGEAILSGLFKVDSAEIRIPDRLPTEIYDLDVIEINAPANKIDKQSDNRARTIKGLKFDLGIDAPSRIFVRGRGLDSEWKGKLTISGSAATTLIKGDISVVRGKYDFFGKPFSLTKGIISFEGQNPPIPRLDVTGEHKIADITARIIVSGSTSAPVIKIESDPPLPSDEVLSRLLFGRSTAGITPFQAIRLAQAVNVLRGGGGGIMTFLDRTRRLLGVDQLDIRQSDEDGGETTLSAGKYVRENVYIELEKGLDADTGKVSVEVELTPNVTLESEAGEDTKTGIGLNWKWDY